MGLRRKSRDALDLPYAWGTEDSSLSLSSLAEDQHGRTAVPMQHYWRGTGAGKPLTAHTHAAGSRQRERGELPQQPSGARRGIAASPQAEAAQTEH